MNANMKQTSTVNESKSPFTFGELFGIFGLACIIIWFSLIQPHINRYRDEKEMLTRELQEAREALAGTPYCYKLYYELYAAYVAAGTVSFDFPCDGYEDLWDLNGWRDGATYASFEGQFSEEISLFLVTMDPKAHLILVSDDPVIELDQIEGYDQFLILGNSFDFAYEAGFEPKPEPNQEQSYIWIDVPNERYNSAVCIAYRMLGGSNGLGGEDPMNPNYDPECAYPTHQEKKYIENP